LPIPETQYARCGDVSIAYQVMGESTLGHAELLEPIRHLLHCGPSHEDEGVREFIR